VNADVRAATRRRRRRPLPEQLRLIEAGLLPGIDFCEHALEESTRGRVVLPEHQAACAVCTRRWRVTEAELQGWAPMTHFHAERAMGDMAGVFTSSARGSVYRPFYAHLARCSACERQLAELTFDLAAPDRGREPLSALRRPVV